MAISLYTDITKKDKVKADLSARLGENRRYKVSNLKRIREGLGLSQNKLADKSGVNVRMIQHYEQGAKDINKAQVGTVYKLAKALKVNIEDLIEK